MSRRDRRPFRIALIAMVGAAALAVGAASSVAGAQAKSMREMGDCISTATCYTPRQLEVAYGVQPLLRQGIDGRGETVVLPELAESQLAHRWGRAVRCPCDLAGNPRTTRRLGC